MSTLQTVIAAASEAAAAAAAELSDWWILRIVEGEAPRPYSRRDGKHLRRIAAVDKICQERASALLKREFIEDSPLQDIAVQGKCFRQGTSLYRALLALLRCRIYFRGGKHTQATQDAAFCIAYGQEDAAIVATAARTWAKIQEFLGDDRGAAIYLSQAIEWSQDETPDSLQRLECILDRLPESARIAYSHKKTEGLKRWLDLEAERQKPLILQKLPKYYWYYEWMTERIQKDCGTLPEPVLDKLLCMDATDLDTLLQSREAIQAQATEFTWILEHEGAERLETYKTPELSWEEVKLIKRGHCHPATLPSSSCEETSDAAIVPLVSCTSTTQFQTRQERLLQQRPDAKEHSP